MTRGLLPVYSFIPQGVTITLPQAVREVRDSDQDAQVISFVLSAMFSLLHATTPRLCLPPEPSSVVLRHTLY